MLSSSCCNSLLFPPYSPVRTSHFSSDGLHVITGSDDTTVKVWDIAEGRNISSLTDATDYVRSMNKSPASRHVWATGSFDHKARLYDLRTGKCIFTLDHGAQIDDIHVLPGGAMVLTVGGPDVRLWDLFTGGILVNTLACHAKAVTSAAVDTVSSRLFTAGLDGYVKVHDLLSLQTQGVIPVGTQALALDVAPDLSRFAVGKADGILELKSSRRISMPHGRQSLLAADIAPPSVADDDDDEMRGWGRGFTRVGEEEEAKRAAPRPGTYRYFYRGAKAKPDDDAAVVRRESTKPLAEHDNLLKQFDHVLALERAMQTKNVAVLCGVVDELMNRNALVGTLERFDWTGLCPLLDIIRQNLLDQTYTAKMTLLLDVILDLHAGELGLCPEALRIVESMTAAVASGIQSIDQFDEIKGGAEMLLSISNDRVR